MTAAPLPRDIPALELHDIRKSYGPNRVLDGISLTVMPGEITALLGENGAGKSTLAHIIAGATRPDGGAIRIAGAAQSFSQPRDALAIGVSAIPQELVYVPQMSVADNILLGRWGTRTGLLTGRSVQRRAREEMRRYGFDLPLASGGNAWFVAAAPEPAGATAREPTGGRRSCWGASACTSRCTTRRDPGDRPAIPLRPMPSLPIPSRRISCWRYSPVEAMCWSGCVLSPVVVVGGCACGSEELRHLMYFPPYPPFRLG